jgi:CRP-like cAMP-binding protein
VLDATELKKVSILSHLSEAGLKKLAAAAEERLFSAGSIIFAEKSEQDSLFIILSGNVRIEKATHSGEQKPIATLSVGGFFGEMALFDDYARSATALAVNDVRVLEIGKKAFMDFLSSGVMGASQVLLEIIRAIAPRIRQTNRELVALYEVGRIIGEQAELGKMLSGLLAVLIDAVSCARGVVLLLNEPVGTLECRAAFGYEYDPQRPGPAEWREPLDGGIAETFLKADSPVIIERFLDDPQFKSVPPVGYETDSMLGAALRTHGHTIGIIVLCDKVDLKGKPARFSPGDANLLSGVAMQASGAIESARLHEEAREKEKLDRVYFRY